MRFSIERACLDQAQALCAIERKAVQLFRGHAVWPVYAELSIPIEALRRSIGRGMVWVAPDENLAPIGFIWLTEMDNGAIAIAELNVLPAHGRQGLGAALLEHACEWARAAGYRQVVLGTLPDVAWNAPFYARHGFATVDAQDPAYAFARQCDLENGFPPHLRVLMARGLSAPATDEWTTWPAPAKLNLFLRITGRRADGYHELQTVFRLLEWGDEICLRVRPDGVIVRSHDVAGVPEASDLAVRAARLLQQHCECLSGAEIAIEKRVPMGGGLGGGSSDAATVLVALNWLWQLHLTEDVLAELGRQLGADVPVFVRGNSAWAEGVGEQLTPLPLPRRSYVIVDPHEFVPTAALFQATELTRNAPRATISSFASGETTENAFAPVVRARHPRVAAALDWLGGFGQARLSGSGGCVFLEVKSFERAVSIAGQCPAAFTAQVAAGVDISPLQRTLARHRSRGA